MARRSLRSARGVLSSKECAYVSIVVDVCDQRLGAAFRGHVVWALEAGATRRDVKEVLLHLVIYASFPKVLMALRELGSVYQGFDEDGLHRTGDDPSHGEPALNLFLEPQVSATLQALDQDFAELALRMGGEIWNRPGLTQKERAYLCLAAHVCNETFDGPVQLHGGMALRAGATRVALRAIVATAGSPSRPARARRALETLEAFLQAVPAHS